MNRDPITRAWLAICLTLALLMPWLWLSGGARGASLPQFQHYQYLPLILNGRADPVDLTATANAATSTATTTRTATTTATATWTATTTATATWTATATQTATRTATTTATSTATATATSTATSTTTATATATSTSTTTATATSTSTATPTSDALATAYLQIANGTGFPMTYTLVGPTYGSGALDANQYTIIPIQTGQYIVTAITHCQTVPVGHDFSISNRIYEINYTCPTP